MDVGRENTTVDDNSGEPELSRSIARLLRTQSFRKLRFSSTATPTTAESRSWIPRMGLAERMNLDPLDVNSYVNIRDSREAYWPGFASRLKTRFIARGLFGNQDRRSGRKCRGNARSFQRSRCLARTCGNIVKFSFGLSLKLVAIRFHRGRV